MASNNQNIIGKENKIDSLNTYQFIHSCKKTSHVALPIHEIFNEEKEMENDQTILSRVLMNRSFNTFSGYEKENEEKIIEYSIANKNIKQDMVQFSETIGNASFASLPHYSSTISLDLRSTINGTSPLSIGETYQPLADRALMEDPYAVSKRNNIKEDIPIKNKDNNEIKKNILKKCIFRYYTLRIYYFWFFIYLLIHICLFLWKYYQYNHRRSIWIHKTYPGVGFARGFAQICLFNGFLLLFPIFGFIFTKKINCWLMNHKKKNILYSFLMNLVNFLEPFVMIRTKLHFLFGTVLIVSGLLHALSHVYIVYHLILLNQFISSNRSLFEKILHAFGGGPPYTIPKYIFTMTGFTGILLVLLSIILLILCLPIIRQKYYDLFRLSHIICCPLWFLCFLLHGMKGWLEKPQAIFWIGLPLLIYLSYRLYQRFIYKKRNYGVFNSNFIKKIDFIPDLNDCKLCVIQIQSNKEYIKKLKNINQFTSINDSKILYLGSYIYLNVPEISLFEWHAFSIVPSILKDDSSFYIYIRPVGEWTNQFIHRLNKIQMNKNNKKNKMTYYIEGPYFSFSVHVFRYQRIIMIGAGVGIAPYLTMLNDYMNMILYNKNNNKMNSHYSNIQIELYWITRTPSDIAIFYQYLMNEEWKSNLLLLIQLNKIKLLFFLTTWKEDMYFNNNNNDNTDSILMNLDNKDFLLLSKIKLLQQVIKEYIGKDIFTGLKLGIETESYTHFGYPNWNFLINKMKEHDKNNTNINTINVGVFMCLPKKVQETVKKEYTNNLMTDNKPYYIVDFFTESF